MKETTTYFSKAALKERGWNDPLIERFLGLPDQTRVNTKHKSGPPICLYDTTRVLTAEQSQEFVDAQHRRAPKREAARRAIATKQTKTDGLLAGTEIQVPQMDQESLTHRAVEHFNMSRVEIGGIFASTNSDDEFLNRIRVNYLRHELTRYDHLLSTMAGKVGAKDARLYIKTMVLDAIADAYPTLSAECIRQLGRAHKSLG